MPKIVGFWRAPGALLAPLRAELAIGMERCVSHDFARGEFQAALVGRADEPLRELSSPAGATVLLTGELLGIGGATGAGPSALLSAYERDPSCTFLARASGVFAGVILDEPRRRIVLFSDALGLGHLYYDYQRERGLRFASEQKCFALAGQRDYDVDPAAVEEFLRHGHLLGQRSWLSQVKLVAPGECVVIDLATGQLSAHTYFALERATRERYGSYEHAKQSVKEAWGAALARSLRGVEQVRAPLAGDPGSRFLFAGLAAQCAELRALTVADYDSDDALYAQRAAAVAGAVQHTARAHTATWLSERARMLFRAEGVDLSHLRYATLRARFAHDEGAAAHHVMQPALYSLLLGRRALRGFDDLRASQLLCNARRSFAAVAAFDQFSAQRYPFADLDFVCAALRVEVPYLSRDRLGLELALELYPEYFEAIPIAHSEGRLARELLAGVPALKPKPGGLPAPDPHAHLRKDANAERWLWQLLSDANARYARYVDAKDGHAAFWSFFKGTDAKSLTELMRYVSLEIWLRQLLDREFVDGLGTELQPAAMKPPARPQPAQVPDVSVIVPAYNVEAYLGECLNSLCNQELENIEIWVIDDGSSDRTPAVIERFARSDARIKVIKLENSGVYHARNRALERATGRYISFVDSDDYVHPSMLRLLFEAAERHRAEVSLCDVYQFDASGVVKLRNNTLRFKSDAPISLATTPEMIADGFSTLWNRLYDRAFLERHALRFDERFRISADMLFLQELLAKANTIVRVPAPLYYYRFATPKSLTSYEVRNKQYLKHLEITIELVDFWVRQKLFQRYAHHVLLKALRNFLWNTHIDDDKLREVFDKFHAYLKKLSVSPVTVAKLPVFERRTFQLLRSGDHAAFRRHIRSYRAKMVASKGGELSKFEQVASEIDALRARVKSGFKLKGKSEPEKQRYRLLWPAAQLGLLFARGEGFELEDENLATDPNGAGTARKLPSALAAAKHRVFLEADLAHALSRQKLGARERILHFSNAFSVPSETFTYDVITGLEEYATLDNYVMCFDRQLVRERPFEKTVEIKGSVRADLEAFEPRTMAKIELVLQELRPDVVHAHFGWVGIPLALYLAREKQPRPLVITMHGTDVNMWPARHAFYADALKAMSDKPWVWFTTHTEVYREKLVRLGVKVEQIEVIPNSFDPKFAQGRAHSVFKPGEHLRVISVARMDIWKGHEQLLRGFARFVRESYPNASLTLVGYGPEEQKLRELVVTLGMKDRVRFYGRAQHYEVPVLLRNHDVYVQPSIKHPETLQEEGQPIAVLEAIASGIPVIVTDTGGMGETVRVADPAGSAWIVPDRSDAAIAAALRDFIEARADESVRLAYVSAIMKKHARHAQLSRTAAVYARALAARKYGGLRLVESGA